MKQLNKLQSTIFLAGGALMVIGVACCVLTIAPTVLCWVYLLGAQTMRMLSVRFPRLVRRFRDVVDIPDICTQILLLFMSVQAVRKENQEVSPWFRS